MDRDPSRTWANPYNVCDRCARQAVWHTEDGRNEPCGHRADFHSVCPSWSPVDGCRCQEHLGHVPHMVPVDTGVADDTGRTG